MACVLVGQRTQSQPSGSWSLRDDENHRLLTIMQATCWRNHIPIQRLRRLPVDRRRGFIDRPFSLNKHIGNTSPAAGWSRQEPYQSRGPGFAKFCGPCLAQMREKLRFLHRKLTTSSLSLFLPANPLTCGSNSPPACARQISSHISIVSNSS